MFKKPPHLELTPVEIKNVSKILTLNKIQGHFLCVTTVKVKTAPCCPLEKEGHL